MSYGKIRVGRGGESLLVQQCAQILQRNTRKYKTYINLLFKVNIAN